MAVKALVVGGKLQGVEISFLAKEAGWEVTVVDRKPEALAAFLCDEYVCADAMRLTPSFVSEFDIVFPAIEDTFVLNAIKRVCRKARTPFAFDVDAYKITSSKRATNGLLAKLGIAVPPDICDVDSWDEGYLVKPNSDSGSAGVRRFSEKGEAIAFLHDHPDFIGQAFLAGKIYSIEVICDRSRLFIQCITEVVVGEDFDCYRITAPALIDESTRVAIRSTARAIGEALDMRGIFDVELIMLNGVPHVLEVDARMPSQTPIAVYYATGVNYVVQLARRFLPSLEALPCPSYANAGHSILQHMAMDGTGASAVGEGVLAHVHALLRADGMFETDAALYGMNDFGQACMTLVFTGERADIAEQKLRACVRILED